MTAAVLASGCAPPAGESLTVVSWGGSYSQAITKGYLEPFTAETGVEIRLDDYNGGLAQVRAQVETGNVHWDVVDLETADAVSGCDEGILEPIDPPCSRRRRTVPRPSTTSCPRRCSSASWARCSTPTSTPTTPSA